MLRLRWVLLLMALGVGLTIYAVLIEVSVRQEVGSGLHRALAHLFYRGDIERYRWTAFLCAVGGPALVVLAFLLWRRKT